MENKKVLIAGGSGFIGKNLYISLKKSGYEVYILSRNKQLCQRPDFIYWNPAQKEYHPGQHRYFEAVINLCGENIAHKKWTKSRKNLLITSRIQPTEFLGELFDSKQLECNTYIGASAIGIYGNRRDSALCKETDKPDPKTFLMQCCKQWEEAHSCLSASTRKVIIRIGLVLASHGGLLEQYRPLLSMRMVPYFGSGHPMMSWITVTDLCRIFRFAIENKTMEGIYNAVSDNPVNSRDFAKAFLKTSGKKGLIRSVPDFAVKFMLGEMAALALESQNVSNEKLKKAGFRFNSKEIHEAFRSLTEK